MTHNSTPTRRNLGGASLRVLCGSLTLGLSLLCMYASFSRAIEVTGRDAVTSWFFFGWGAAMAFGGAWLIRGRSKGRAIVFARDRRRLIVVASLAVLVVGLLVYLVSQSSMTEDEEWPFLLQTMFAILFASVFFLLFDREDYKERARPKPLTAAGRRKAKRFLIIIILVGALAFTTGIVAEIQVDSWWSEGLYRLGTALLASGAVIGFGLRKNR